MQGPSEPFKCEFQLETVNYLHRTPSPEIERERKSRGKGPRAMERGQELGAQQMQKPG